MGGETVEKYITPPATNRQNHGGGEMLTRLLLNGGQARVISRCGTLKHCRLKWEKTRNRWLGSVPVTGATVSS